MQFAEENIQDGRGWTDEKAGRQVSCQGASRGPLWPKAAGRVGAAILLLSILGAAQSERSKDLHDLDREPPSLEGAISLLEQNKYAAAKAELLQVIDRHPTRAQAFFYLGTAEYHLGELNQAEKAYRRSFELDPNSPSTAYNLGVLLLDMKRPAEAIPYLEKAAKAGPADAAVSINLIRAYLDNGERGRAFRLADSSSQNFRNSPAFFLALGKFYLRHGLFAQAREALEQAGRLTPSEPAINLPLAEACLEQKDARSALQALRSVQDKCQDLAQFHYLMAQSFFLGGQREQTMEEIARAARLEPSNDLYLVTMGRYDQKYGQQEKAIGVFEEAARLNPRQAAIPYSMAVSYFIEGDFNQASKFVECALTIRPNFSQALFLLGISKIALEKYAQADALLLQAIKLNPRNPYYECFLGMSLLSENRSPEAEIHLRRAVDLRPSYALPHFKLGILFARQDNYRAARTELEQAVALEPDLYEAYYQLGIALERLGEKQKAAEALRTFQKYQAGEYSERQEILKQMQRAVEQEP
jgi:tetratricopeptide (TPR) repeat protein